MGRRILHVVWNDRTTNAAERKRNSRNDIVAVAGSLKWIWGGYVAITDQRRWVHAASVWGLRAGKRRMGAIE